MFPLHTTLALETPITTGPMTPSSPSPPPPPPQIKKKITSSQHKHTTQSTETPKPKSPLKHGKPRNPINTLNHSAHWDTQSTKPTETSKRTRYTCTPNNPIHWNSKTHPLRSVRCTAFVHRWARVRLGSVRVWFCSFYVLGCVRSGSDWFEVRISIWFRLSLGWKRFTALSVRVGYKLGGYCTNWNCLYNSAKFRGIRPRMYIEDLLR